MSNGGVERNVEIARGSGLCIRRCNTPLAKSILPSAAVAPFSSRRNGPLLTAPFIREKAIRSPFRNRFEVAEFG